MKYKMSFKEIINSFDFISFVGNKIKLVSTFKKYWSIASLFGPTAINFG